MTAVVYTDASHDHIRKIAACGYCIVVKGRLQKVEVYLYSHVQTTTHAETLAITAGMQNAFDIKGVKQIVINSDSRNALSNISAKRILYDNQDVFDTIEVFNQFSISFKFNHVRGHNGNKYNELVDYYCNTHLRLLRKQIRTRK